MLRVRCPNCDKTITCDQEFAGERISCPNCNAHVVVPFDTPDHDAIRERAEETKRAAEPKETRRVAAPPAVAEKPPAKIEDLLDLQRQQHAELCRELAEVREQMRTSSKETLRVAKMIRSNTTVIGVLFVFIAIPMILIGGCTIIGAGSAIKEAASSQQDAMQSLGLDLEP